jgi:hypothetical protein
LPQRVYRPRLRRLPQGNKSTSSKNLLSSASIFGIKYYDFVRVHRTLRVTPAMEARVSDRLWSLDEFIERTSN